MNDLFFLTTQQRARTLVAFLGIIAVLGLTGCDTTSPWGEGPDRTTTSTAPLPDSLVGIAPVSFAALDLEKSGGSSGPDGASPEAASTNARYLCALSIKTSDGYALRRIRLDFPERIVRDAKRKRKRMTYRLVSVDGTPLRSARCVIPAHPQAKKHLARTLRFEGADGYRAVLTDEKDLGVVKETNVPLSARGQRFCRGRKQDCYIEKIERTGADVATNYFHDGSFTPEEIQAAREAAAEARAEDASTSDPSKCDGEGGGSYLPPSTDPAPGPWYPPSWGPHFGGGGSGGGGDNPPEIDPSDCPDDEPNCGELLASKGVPGGEVPDGLVLNVLPGSASAQAKCGGGGSGGGGSDPSSPLCIDCPGDDGGEEPPEPGFFARDLSSGPTTDTSPASKSEVLDIFERRGLDVSENDVVSDAFEDAVNRAFNSVVGLRKFQSVSKYSNSSVLGTRKIQLDGARRAYIDSSTRTYLNRISDLIEVKFTERLDIFSQARQWQDHINLLQNQVSNLGEIMGAPRYFIISMGSHSLSDIEWQFENIIRKGNEDGIEVYHLLIVKDENDNFFIKGQRLNPVQEGYNRGTVVRPIYNDGRIQIPISF